MKRLYKLLCGVLAYFNVPLLLSYLAFWKAEKKKFLFL